MMNIEEFRSYCLSKPEVEETLPFGPSALVFKVLGKMFAICDIEHFTGFSAKCEPERAIELREAFPNSIEGAYHMNKKHWNSVRCDGSVPHKLICELIDDSYQLVAQSLPKKHREKLDENR